MSYDRTFLTKYHVDFISMPIPVADTSSSTILLPINFEPSNYDIICGRGKACYDHIGNRRFRITADINLHKYMNAASRFEKSLVVNSIVDQIKETSSSSCGGFVKKDPLSGRWYALGDEPSREKIGHTLRVAAAVASKSVCKRQSASSIERYNCQNMQRTCLLASQEAIFASLTEKAKANKRRTFSAQTA